MIKRGLVSMAVIGAFLMVGNVSLSGDIAPTWSYKIQSMADFSMSGSGDYLIVACEKGPHCDEGQFYVFDRYGNILRDDCIKREITAIDIADNGTFFLGTFNGYYFSSISEEIPENPEEVEGTPELVSVSKNGESAVVVTEKKILICDRENITNEKPAPGESTMGALAVSDDGSTIACYISTGVIWILNSQLKTQVTWKTQGGTTGIALTADGSRLLYGTLEGKVFCLDSSGNLMWEYPEEPSEEPPKIKGVAITFDGRFLAVLSEDTTLSDSSIMLFSLSTEEISEGVAYENVQESKSSEIIQRIQFSRCGDILSYSLRDELILLELGQRDHVLTHEYMSPSKAESESILLEEEWSYNGNSPPQSAIEADINGDGQKEIICSFSKEIVALTSEGKELWRTPLKLEFESEIVAMDLDFDFVPEIVATSKNNLMRFQVFDGNKKELARKEFYKEEFYKEWYSDPPSEDNAIRIRVVWSGDIDNDGSIEIVCKVSATGLTGPRGIYVFEYPSFKEEWFYSCAPNIETVNIVDLDNDGDLEIVWGSSAPCDGAVVKNTDDCHTYVFAVDSQGEELWITEIGREYETVSIAVADLEGDGTNEVVCGGRFFESSKENRGALFALDAQGDYIKRMSLSLDYLIYLKGVSDLELDGDMEILVCDVDMTLAVYDHNFEPVEKSSVGVPGSFDLTVNDLDGDGQKEIIAISDKSAVIVLNSYLEEGKSFSDQVNKVVVVNLSRCKNDFLVLADKLYLYSHRDHPEQPCTLPSVEERINSHIKKGEMYLENEDYSKAKEEYELAIKMLEQVDNIELELKTESGLEEATEGYRTQEFEAEQCLKDGKSLKDSEEYLQAADALMEARRNYSSLGESERMQGIDDELLDVAQQLLQEGKDSLESLESEDLQEAEESLLKAREIYDFLDSNKARKNEEELQETLPDLADGYILAGEEELSQGDYEKAIEYYEKARAIYLKLGITETLAEREEISALIYIVKGKEKESQEDYKGARESYEEAIAYYEKARKIYEEARESYENLDNAEKVEDVEGKIEDVEGMKSLASIPIINTLIIEIAFAVSVVVVSLLYLVRKQYRGKDKQANTFYYLITIVVLTSIFMISLFAVSLPLGKEGYFLIFSITLFFALVVGSYLRRS